LLARHKKHPSPGSAETFREYLRQRWDAGYHNGRLLLDEVRALGYQGTYNAVGKIVSPWRQGNVDFERAADDITIPAPPPVLTDPSPELAPHCRDVADDPATRPNGWQRADRRCVESRVSGLRGDAFPDDGLSGAAQTVRTDDHNTDATPNGRRLTPVDGSRARQRHCQDSALRVPITGRHSRGGGGRHRALEQRPPSKGR
jgi:hypothetical protein